LRQFAFVWTLSALAQTLTGRVVGDYEAAEGRVAADRVGLWQDANPTAPWEWRKAPRRSR